MKRLVFALALFLASLCASLCAPAAHAQSPAETRATGFRAATGAQHEKVPGGPLVIGAYGAAFVLVLLYLVSLGFRQARTTRDLERLRQEIKQNPRSAPSGKLPPEEF